MNVIIQNAIIGFIINTIGDYFLKKFKISHTTEREAIKSRWSYINESTKSTSKKSVNSNQNKQSVDNNNFNNTGNVNIKNASTQINNYIVNTVKTVRAKNKSFFSILAYPSAALFLLVLCIGLLVGFFYIIFLVYFSLRETMDLDSIIIVVTGSICAFHRIVFSKSLSKHSFVYLYKDRYDLYMIILISISILLSNNFFMPDAYLNEYSIIAAAAHAGTPFVKTFNFVASCGMRAFIHFAMPIIPLADMIYYFFNKKSILINIESHIFVIILGIGIAGSVILPYLLY